jgi:hypothetical protein
MRRLLTALIALAIFLPDVTEAQDKRPGIMIPGGIGVNGGVGTWGSRIGLIVGNVRKSEDEVPSAIGILLVGEAATQTFRAVGIGIGGAAGLGLGPFVPLSFGGFRATINRAAWNPTEFAVRRTATGVSLGLTYPLLNYDVTLYRVHKEPGLAAGWQWRLGFGLGF